MLESRKKWLVHVFHKGVEVACESVDARSTTHAMQLAVYIMYAVARQAVDCVREYDEEQVHATIEPWGVCSTCVFDRAQLDNTNSPTVKN